MKLDPYKGIIEVRLAAYLKLSAAGLFNEMQGAGCAGGCEQVRRYVREVRPREPEEPVGRFETPPGHQGQVDFADFRLPWGRRHALVVVGYSRKFVSEADLNARARRWVEGEANMRIHGTLKERPGRPLRAGAAVPVALASQPYPLGRRPAGAGAGSSADAGDGHAADRRSRAPRAGRVREARKAACREAALAQGADRRP